VNAVPKGAAFFVRLSGAACKIFDTKTGEKRDFTYCGNRRNGEIFAAPFVVGAIAGAMLPSWRSRLVGWIIVGASVALAFATWQARDFGFSHLGGNCGEAGTRAFMQTMQSGFVIIAGALTFGGGIVSGAQIRKHAILGGAQTVVMLTASCFVAFLIFFGAGMTAVDGYVC
jgi:hypothetical protein